MRTLGKIAAWNLVGLATALGFAWFAWDWRQRYSYCITLPEGHSDAACYANDLYMNFCIGVCIVILLTTLFYLLRNLTARQYREQKVS